MKVLPSIIATIGLFGSTVVYGTPTWSSSAYYIANADDKSGMQWQTVASKHGRFSILMPAPVSKTSQEVGSHRTVTYNSVLPASNSNFTVSYTTYGEEYLRKHSRTKLLKESIHLAVSSLLGKVVKRQAVDVDGCEAIEFEFEGHSRSTTHTGQEAAADLHGIGRAVFANDTTYLLLCDTVGSAPETSCEKFISSFKILP